MLKVSSALAFATAALSFLVLNAPSVKLFYSSEIVNLISVGALVYVGVISALVHGAATVNKSVLIVLSLNLLLWGLLYLSVVWGQHSRIDVEILLRYAGSMVAISAIAILMQPSSAIQLGWMQASWGVVLGICLLAGVINLYQGAGQHYLTIGVPLGASIVSAVGLLLSAPRKSRLVQIFLIGDILVCLAALASLLGRSPILFSAALLGLTSLVYALTARTLMKKIFGILALSTVLSLMVVTATKYLQEGWWARLERLASHIELEPRYRIYAESIDAIARMPFGSGLGASFDLIGFYPHNMFLEVALTSGILATLPLVVLCCMAISSFFIAVRDRHPCMPVALTALYMLLVWNVSFDLGTAYVPLGFAAVAIVVLSRGKRIEGFGSDCDAKSSAHAPTRLTERASSDEVAG